MRVAPLTGHDELARYVSFGAEVYRGNPYWVPPDEHHLVASLSGDVPAAAHCRLQPFWAREGDRVLATATALVDDLFNRHWKDSMGHILFFEALPDGHDAAVATLAAACDWLRDRGCRAARLSFLYGWQLPLTIDAYDVVPTALHTYNPPYYHGFVKDAGFATESGQSEYRVEFTPELDARYEDMEAGAGAIGVALRSWDLDRLDREAALLTESYNESFATQWGAPVFTLDDLSGLLHGLKELLVPEFTVFATHDGTTVGSVLALPDFHQALHGASAPGSPGPVDHGILLNIAVSPAFRGRGLNLAMAARCYRAMMARGYRSASYTMVLDQNRPSRRTAEKLGARVARNFVVYRREL